MLTDNTQNNSVEEGVFTSEEGGNTGPLSNIPVSPPVQSHFPSREEVEGDGYDLDNGIDHNIGIVSEGPLECNEPDIPEVAVATKSTPSAKSQENSGESQENMGEFVDIPRDKLLKLKVSELKSKLAKHGQNTTGLKAVLQQRLKEALEQHLPLLSQSDQATHSTDDLTGFAPSAHWKPLVATQETVEEPHNASRFQAPTIPEEDREFVPQKHNFLETFDWAPFIGTEKVCRHHRNGHPVIINGDQVWDDIVKLKGAPKPEFLEEHGLDDESTPQEWFKAFLPVFDGTTNNPRQSNTPYWTHHWCNYTNRKVMMLGAGVPGGVYPSWKPFSYDEIERFIGIYILQGLKPSPQVEMKFKSQRANPIQGNDMCSHVFGSDAVRRHKQFKAFFSVQDPLKVQPDCKVHPMYKVDPLLVHTQVISMQAWRLGRDISGDEQTLGFQGRNADKLHITYKAEGDGFQCDAICDTGYTWTFFFRNQPAPQKWRCVGYSPLNSRILGMFNLLENKHHNCWFDNLYLSAKFAKASYKHDNKVHISGPMQKSGRGLPKCVVQEEKTLPSEILAV